MQLFRLFIEKPAKRQENADTLVYLPSLTHTPLLYSLPALQIEFGKSMGLQAGPLSRPGHPWTCCMLPYIYASHSWLQDLIYKLIHVDNYEKD